jgi:pilus assembly protein TadC
VPLVPGWLSGASWLVGPLIFVVCYAWPGTGEAARARLARLRAGGAESPRRSRAARLGGRPDEAAAAAMVATALDVLGACLYSGAPLEWALRAVAGAFDGAVADVLGGVARQTALGAPVEVAWAAALADPQWAVAARAVVRAHYSGAPLTDVLSRTADERRRALRAAAEAAASRAGVRAVLPLGVCFLPAFVLVGIVPVIAGFARSLWS